MQDPGLLQDQFTTVSNPSYFSPPILFSDNLQHRPKNLFLDFPKDIFPSGIFLNTFFTNFMVTPCINNVELFYYQLMHIILKNTELLKHSKITLQHVSVYTETIFRELKSVLG